MGFSRQLTDTTLFTNDFLVESGSSNTFTQNEAAVSLTISQKLSLKAGWTWRHNTETEPGTGSTDTLTKFNLVFSF